MRWNKQKIIFSLLLTFICSGFVAQASENLSFTLSESENNRNPSVEFDEVQDFFTLHQLNNGQCNGGCVNIIENIQQNFSELILFETLIIPLLNNRRASLQQINKLGQQHITRLISSIRRYNPSLNVKNLRSSLKNLISKTARAAIRGNLDQQAVKQQLQNNFKRITQFFRKFIFGNFQVNPANGNFRRIVSLMARLNRRNINDDTGAYRSLSKSVLNLLTIIKAN